MSLNKIELQNYTGTQLKNFLPDKYIFQGSDIEKAINLALERTEFCLQNIAIPGYVVNGSVDFSHLHSDKYSTYLYFLANSLWDISNNKPICDKLILLNKILNGIWVTYKCKLPDVFLLSHPLGSILGNAVYSNFLCVFQNVTVNTGMKIGEYNPPVLGKGVVLATGAAIIGNSVIGDKVTISDTMIYKKNIPSNSSVFRDDEGKLIIKKRKEENYYGQQFFFEKI